MFDFKHFKFLPDYAHNPAGLRSLQKLVTHLEGHPKIGIISGIGDRKVEDTIAVGQIVSEMFDEIIIRIDRDLRGRPR